MIKIIYIIFIFSFLFCKIIVINLKTYFALFIVNIAKVRWIVEKIFARFSHHAALTNIRNKQVGHIMVDYRICAAMLNFTHKCSTSDVSKSKKIAKRVNNRLTTYINPLSFLIKRRLDTRLIKKVKLSDIIDFPRLKQKVMET